MSYEKDYKLPKDKRKINQKIRAKAIGSWALMILMFPLYIIFGLIINLLELYINLFTTVQKKTMSKMKGAINLTNTEVEVLND